MVVRRPLRKKPGATKPAATTSAKTPIRRPSSTGKSPTTKTAPRTTSAGMAKGADGFNRAKEQQDRQQEEYDRKKEKPFPFRITKKDMQERKNVADLLYLDKEPFFVRLHTVPLGGNRYEDEVCLADTGEPCPLCHKLGKEGTWTLVMTALDKRPYRTREGKLVRQSKKLVMAKSRNIAKFERQFLKHKTFRGLICTHRRAQDKEASIGEDLEFKTKLVPEAVLSKSGDLAKVTDYAKAYAPLSADAMESKYAHLGSGGGGGGGGGNRRASEEEDDGAPQW